MEQHARLLVHRGAQPITREALSTIEPPPSTDTWKPIKHSAYVDAIHDELVHRNITVDREEYAVQRQGNVLFGVMDLAFMQTETFAAALAFRHANDQSEAVKMYAGVRVFNCDNMTISGDEIILRHKHSTRFNLAAALPEAFDRYHEGELALHQSIETLQNTQLPHDKASLRIYDIFRKKVVPIRLFHPVVTEYYGGLQTPEAQGTEWQLLNCFTAHTKTLLPAPQMHAMQRLGRYFGLGTGHVHV